MKELYKVLLLTKITSRIKYSLLKDIEKQIEIDMEELVDNINNNQLSLELINEKINNIDFELKYKSLIKEEFSKEDIDIN